MEDFWDTVLLTITSRISLENLMVTQLYNKFDLWNPKDTTMFTRAHHWATWIHTMPSQAVKFHFDIIPFYSFHVVSSLKCFSGKILCTFLIAPMLATCPDHLILHNFITLIIDGEECKVWRSPLCNFLHPPVTSSLLGPYILLRTSFSNTFNLCSSIRVMGQVSYPYKKRGTIVVFLHINVSFN